MQKINLRRRKKKKTGVEGKRKEGRRGRGRDGKEIKGMKRTEKRREGKPMGHGKKGWKGRGGSNRIEEIGE